MELNIAPIFPVCEGEGRLLRLCFNGTPPRLSRGVLDWSQVELHITLKLAESASSPFEIIEAQTSARPPKATSL